ncbi:hypothetical protein [Aestuariirhabdus sp. LZHN29]|uniref:hypothetical protein n=1 Tax=Aestuariirhabdus sp. LZHN29 TaxID=3417462 RepID=UPI003CF83EB8
MTLSFHQQAHKHSSRINILVVLLVLFVVSGNCSAAMGQSQLVGTENSVDLSSHGGHCDDVPRNSSTDVSNDINNCWDELCSSSMAPFKSSSAQLGKQQVDDGEFTELVPVYAQRARAGPCAQPSYSLQSSDFVTPPLYYTLCVLRI